MNDLSNTRIAFGTGRDTLTVGRNAGLVGYPHPAKPCRCAVPWVEDEGCLRCGYWLHATIRETWRVQARRMAGSQLSEAGAPRPYRREQRRQHDTGVAARLAELASPGLAGVAL